MNSFVCAHCGNLKAEVFESIYQAKSDSPYMCAHVQLRCGKQIMSTIRIGGCEPVSKEFVKTYLPDDINQMTLVTDKDSLPESMRQDYDRAFEEGLSQITWYAEHVIPKDCPYRFEHEFTEMQRRYSKKQTG